MPATTTTADEKAFLARIATNPADDTDRLVYADWLDENAANAHCPNCAGSRFSGRVPHDHMVRNTAWLTCPRCGGTSKVPDGRRQRAEYIRDGVEAARCGVEHYQPLDPQATDWRRAGVCPECSGSGSKTCPDCVHWKGHVPRDCRCRGARRIDCPACWGSGDIGGLLPKWAIDERHDAGLLKGDERFKYRVDFVRGFPHRVHCRLGEVCEVPGLSAAQLAEVPRAWSSHVGRRPTPWALAVVRHHPVTQFRVDLPFNSTDNANAWHKSTIPDFLFDLIQGHDGTTPDAAHAAMAAALGAWVRSFAYPKETT